MAKKIRGEVNAHPNYEKYVEFIVNHPNYKGLYYERDEEGHVKWVVTDHAAGTLGQILLG